MGAGQRLEKLEDNLSRGTVNWKGHDGILPGVGGRMGGNFTSPSEATRQTALSAPRLALGSSSAAELAKNCWGFAEV